MRSKIIEGYKERCFLGQNTKCEFLKVILFFKLQNNTRTTVKMFVQKIISAFLLFLYFTLLQAHKQTSK